MASTRVIDSLLGARAKRRLADGRHTLSGAELAQHVAAVAAWLRAAGVGPEACCCVEFDGSLAGLSIVLALLELGDGFVLVPAGEGKAAPSMCRRRLAVREAANLADIGTWLIVEAGAAEDGELRPIAPGLLLSRGSGRPGTPAFVAHAHAQIMADAASVAARLALRPDDRVLISIPHMLGLWAALLPALVAGADIELGMQSAEPTVIYMTSWAARARAQAQSGPAGTRVVVVGEKLDADEFAALELVYGRVLNLYATAELGVICAADATTAIAADDYARATCVGQPLPGVELDVRELPGETHPDHVGNAPIGELLWRRTIGSSYLDDRDELVEGDEPYPTGELARIYTDGRVELFGRCDHAVKRDGKLVPLAEVEAVLSALDEVDRAAVVAGPEGARGPEIVAFCQLRPDVRVSAEQLQRSCQERLPSFAMPDRVELSAKLPLLAGGELDRQGLQASLSR